LYIFLFTAQLKNIPISHPNLVCEQKIGNRVPRETPKAHVSSNTATPPGAIDSDAVSSAKSLIVYGIN
jgi:hypothetical protein